MKTTVVVQFGASADSSSLVVVELDGTLNLDDKGNEKSSFIPGDQPYFLVHHDSSLRIGAIACSSGMVQDLGSVLRTRKTQLSFPDVSTQQLNYFPASAPVFSWYGNSPAASVTGRDVAVADTVPAICEVSMDVTFSLFRLIPPTVTLGADETYCILVVVTMESV